MAEPKVRFKRDDGSDFPAWKVVTIGEIVDKQSIPVSVNPEKLYREIGIRSHGKGLFHKEPIQGIELGNKRVFEIIPGCLVVNIVFAWERAVSKTTTDEIGMIASHRFPMYKPKDGILDLDYIVRYLITDRGKQLLELASPGGAGRNRTLGQKEFANSKLILPCYEEQKKIATLLVDLDAVITASEEEVANLETQKKAVMKKIFSQEVRFKRADGSDFPEWIEKALGSVAGVYDGTHQTPEYVAEGIKFVSVENINDLYGSNKYITEDAFMKQYKNNAPQKGDVLMTRIGDIGTAALVSSDEQLAYYVSLALLKPSSMISPKYLVQAIASDFFQSELWVRTLHTAYPKKINKEDIGKCMIQVPCLEEQRLIADFLSDLDEAIAAAKKELELWKELKKGLLQQMFV